MVEIEEFLRLSTFLYTLLLTVFRLWFVVDLQQVVAGLPTSS